ncbi:MAG: triose-phosphate isomerase, partial [Gammaproteobacteria bacterium]|nr:triose-phosphate isomerase [Gammaproteobacteria bacterium]
VNQKNSKNIFSLSDVDGGLVGGASLTYDSFIPIITSLENQTEII